MVRSKRSLVARTTSAGGGCLEQSPPDDLGEVRVRRDGGLLAVADQEILDLLPASRARHVIEHDRVVL